MSFILTKRLFISSVLLLAIILNLGLSVHMHHNSTAPEKGGLWSSTAENLYHYGVYSSGERDEKGNLVPTASIPPFFTYTCFIIFSLVGVTAKAFTLISVLSILMNIGIIFLTYQIGKLFSYRAGCIAALAATLDLNLIYWANSPSIPDTMLTFFMAFSYFYLLKFMKCEPTYQNIIGGSVFLGLALLTKSVAYPLWLPISLFLMAFMLKVKKDPKQILCQVGTFLLIQALCIGGWQLRNYFVSGKAQFHSPQGDVLLAQTGFLKAYQEGISFAEAKTLLYSKRKEMNENEWNLYSTRTAVGMMRDAPWDYAVLMLKGVPKLLMRSKPPFFLYSKEKANNILHKLSDVESHLQIRKELWSKGYMSYFFWWGYIKLHLLSVYMMSLYGMVLLFKRANDRLPLLLLLFIIIYFILVSVPSAESRYRYPIMPLFYFLSGYAWNFLCRTRPRSIPITS